MAAAGSKKLRIAIVGRVDSGIAEDLGALPGKVSIRVWDDLYEDFEAIQKFEPSVLCFSGEEFREVDLGTLRLLRRDLDPSRTATIFVTPRDRELELASLARRAEARILPTPYRTQELADAVDLGDTTVRAESGTFVDIARGVADEISNPLMFADGHLQLLRSALESEANEGHLQFCHAIGDGLARIAATMNKVRILARVQDLRPPFGTVQVESLFDAVLAKVELTEAVELEIDEPARNAAVSGDPDLLRQALEFLLAVTVDLGRHASGALVLVGPIDDDLRIRVRLRGDALQAWDGPRSFEPYYLNRVLRGSPHGLSLFLVQAIVHAHGGRALARRRKNGDLQFELHLLSSG